MTIESSLEKRRGQIIFHEFIDKKNHYYKLLVRVGTLMNISVDLKMALDCCAEFKEDAWPNEPSFQQKLLWNNMLLMYTRSFEGGGLNFKEVYRDNLKDFRTIHLNLVSARNECVAHWDTNKNLIIPVLYFFLEDGQQEQEAQFNTWHLHHNKFKASDIPIIRKMIGMAILYCENNLAKIEPKLSFLTLLSGLFKKTPLYKGPFPLSEDAENKLIRMFLKQRVPNHE